MQKSLTEAIERAKVSEQQYDEERRVRRGTEDRAELLEDYQLSDRNWIRRTICRVREHDPDILTLISPLPRWYRDDNQQGGKLDERQHS